MFSRFLAETVLAAFDGKGDFVVSELQTLRWFAFWFLSLAVRFYVSHKNASEDDYTIAKEIFVRTMQRVLCEKSLLFRAGLVE